MGYAGDGANSLKMNHSMIRSRGTAFKKVKKVIVSAGKTIPVNETRMAAIAQSAHRKAIVQLVLVIVVIGLVYILMML